MLNQEWYVKINIKDLLQPKPVRRAETVEEFLARGGQIEYITETTARDPERPAYARWKTAYGPQGIGA